MTTYVRAWAQNGALFFVTTSPEPITFDNYQGPHDASWAAEIEGDFIPAGTLMPQLSIVNGALAGVAFASQQALPPPAPPSPDEVAAALAQWRATASLSFPQMVTGLVLRGWITRAEQRAWLAGVPPQRVVELIDALPEHLIDITYGRATRPSAVMRSDPIVSMLAGLVPGQTLTEADLDDFFRDCAAL